jgi:hypothetical protein
VAPALTRIGFPTGGGVAEVVELAVEPEDPPPPQDETATLIATTIVSDSFPAARTRSTYRLTWTDERM